MRWIIFPVLLIALACPAAAEPTTKPEAQNIDGRPLGVDEPIRYRHARDTDRFYPVNLGNWWGHIAQNGDLIVFPNYAWTDYFYDNRARAIQGGKTGYLKRSGNWLIDPVYPWADRFAEKVAVVGDGEGKFGYIDLRGQAMTPVEFDGALRFREDYGAVMVGDRAGFVNRRGRIAIEPQFARVRSFHDGRAAVQFFDRQGNPERWGYIDKAGNVLFHDTTGRVLQFGDFNDGYARVQVAAESGEGDPLWGYIDKAYKLRLEPAYHEARDFVGGVAAVRVDDKWGFIDKTGRMVVQPQFTDADDFDDTLAMVAEAKEYGFVDKSGRRVIEPQFNRAEPFVLRLARVYVEPSFGYIDTAGRIIWDPRWQRTRRIVDTTARTRAYIDIHDTATGDAVLPKPPAREPQAAPYPPEHEYEEILPPLP